MNKDEFRFWLAQASPFDRLVLDQMAVGFSHGFTSAHRIAGALGVDSEPVLRTLESFAKVGMVTHVGGKGWCLCGRMTEFFELRAASNFS